MECEGTENNPMECCVWLAVEVELCATCLPKIASPFVLRGDEELRITMLQ